MFTCGPSQDELGDLLEPKVTQSTFSSIGFSLGQSTGLTEYSQMHQQFFKLHDKVARACQSLNVA